MEKKIDGHRQIWYSKDTVSRFLREITVSELQSVILPKRRSGTFFVFLGLGAKIFHGGYPARMRSKRMALQAKR